MARAPTSAQPLAANLTAAQMAEAIPKIQRRIQEVESFDPLTTIDRTDPKISTLEKRLQTLLANTFGHGTIEYYRYENEVTNLDRTVGNFYSEETRQEIIDGLSLGKTAVILHLNEILNWFQEEIGDAGGTPVGTALRAYQNLALHNEIVRASNDLYRDGHYAQAIENSVKALNNLVRLRSGVEERDGAALMEFVFSPGNPILKFNALADQSDRDEQKGFMMMMSGAVAGLRNPRAHKIIKDDPETTLEFIAFVSLLAKLVDKARK